MVCLRECIRERGRERELKERERAGAERVVRGSNVRGKHKSCSGHN
jgi:hypothetical protein